jgi:hypothetical protein
MHPVSEHSGHRGLDFGGVEKRAGTRWHRAPPPSQSSNQKLICSPSPRVRDMSAARAAPSSFGRQTCVQAMMHSAPDAGLRNSTRTRG